MSLPVPTDPAFSVDPTEDEFLHPKGDEDEALLATGAWDDVPNDDPATLTPKPPARKVKIHIHRGA